MVTRSGPTAVGASIFLAISISPLPEQVVEEDDTEILKPIARTEEPEDRPGIAEAAKLVTRQVDQFREAEGLGKVEVSPALRKAARQFADYMARTNRYGHK